MRTINHEQALAALTTVVTEAGEDFHYQNDVCEYVVDGEPSCLVGQALSELGVKTDILAEMDAPQQGDDDNPPPKDTSIEGVAYVLREMAGVNLTPRAVAVLAAAQTVQDIRHSWGTALKEAQKEAHKEIKDV